METVPINNRQFLKEKNKYVFDRKYPRNQDDITHCAALAFHKALIGVCSVSSLETAEQNTGINLRPSKAVQTYYVLYHLFTCCMLLDNDYEIAYMSTKKRPFKYGTDLEELRLKPCGPDDWNDRKDKEMDLATKISHGNIKCYCRDLRDRMQAGKIKTDSFIKPLYDAFVKGNCRVILFEKADYIRDRSIYRPSHLASLTDTAIQTSKNVRNQIDSLPSSDTLYDSICDIFHGILYLPEDEMESFVLSLKFTPVDCPTEYAMELGYTWEQLSEYGGDESRTSVPSYICQLMELYSPGEVRSYYMRYWKPILTEIQNKISPK